MKNPCILAIAAALALPSAAFATAATWNGGTDYKWSTGQNWSSSSAPTTSDTAALADTTVNRTIIYDSAASGALGTLSITQTSAFLNELSFQRSFTITQAVALGASTGGTAQITLAAQTAGITGAFSNGLTVNSGGVLALNGNGSGNSNYTVGVSGNVTLNGGQISVGSWPINFTGGSIAATISNNLTVQSGTILINNTNGTVVKDVRLIVSGNLNMTGGLLTTATNSQPAYVEVDGATASITGGTVANSLSFSLARSGDQSFTFTPSVGNSIGVLYLRGSGTKTVTSSATITTLQFMTGGAANVTAGLKLGGNVTATSLVNAAPATSTGTLSLGVDANGSTLQLTGSTAFAPSNAGSNTLTQWTLSSSAANGRIKAYAYNLAGANTTVSVGSNLTLEATGSNGTANNLGSGTALDAQSTFLYSGGATSASAATLTSARAIGKLEIGTGALSVSGTFQAAGGIAVDNGATLIVSGSGNLSGNASLAAGATLAGAGTVTGNVTATGATIKGSGLNLTGSTILKGASTLSGYNIASSVTVQSGSTSLTGTTSATNVSVSAGAILNNGGLVQSNASVGGLLTGHGTITGTLALSGTLSGGNTLGTTAINGGLTMDSTAVLALKVTGTAAGAYDQLKVSGDVTLKGTLDLTTLTGLALQDSITLIDNLNAEATTTGYFSTIVTSEGSLSVSTPGSTYTFTVAGKEYELNYAANADNDGKYNDVTLTVVPEPGTWAMLTGGLALLAMGQRLRRARFNR